MANTGILNVILRTSTRKGDNNALKRDGYLLANITGKGLDSVAIAIKKDEFHKAVKAAGRNGVFTLTVSDSQKYTAMLKEIHVETLKNQIQHLDFQIVSLSVKMKQDVAIKIIGTEMLEAKKLLISSSADMIVVEGLPQDIPDEIVIDVSELEADQSIDFKDLKLPEGITADLDADQKIVTVVNSKMHEEPTETEAAAEESTEEA